MLAALILFALVGERSPRLAFFVYLPRFLFLLPLPFLIWLCSKRWRAVPIATSLLVLWPLMGLHFGHSRSGERALRLLSWQVWYGAGDAAVLDREVRAADPDVVVFEAAGHNADRVLQDGRFLYYLHESAFVIASRWPAKLVKKGEWVSTGVGRPWVQFEVEAPVGKLEVVAVHTQSVRQSITGLRKGGLKQALIRGESYGGDLERLDEHDEHLADVDRVVHEAGPLALACGDFNATDGGAVLRNRFAGFIDAWTSTNFGYGWTFPANTRKPRWLRLDRVYTSPGLVPLDARVIGGTGSDHSGILVDLALAREK